MYWPELYFNQSMVDAQGYGPYFDAQEPRVFGNASPFDPALFLSIDEYAEELLDGNSSGKYSPLEVAQWIEDFAAAARAALALAETSASGRSTAAYRRMKVDIQIQAGLGEFFGAKFRSGMLFHVYEITREHSALEASIALYKKARAAWAMLAEVAKDVYVSDITVGEQAYLRGHWIDRLPAIDKDIAALSTLLNGAANGQTSPRVGTAMRTIQGRPRRAPIAADHKAPVRFQRGDALALNISAPPETDSVMLHYRHLDQAENYASVAMERQGSQYVASIPAVYTTTVFPLEYFFTIAAKDGKSGLYPGFAPELTNQPYFLVRAT